MDEVLQRAFPTVLAPRFSMLEPMSATGERFVLTNSRLMFEVSRPWLHAVRGISSPFERKTPYGDGPLEGVTLRCGPIPQQLLNRFIEQAKQAYPQETAAWVVWNEADGQFAYQSLATLSAGEGHVHFERPALPLGWHQVMDIHSHGRHDAFFSKQDDIDDKDQLCVSVVVGQVDQPRPAVLARLSMLGVYSPLGVF